MPGRVIKGVQKTINVLARGTYYLHQTFIAGTKNPAGAGFFITRIA